MSDVIATALFAMSFFYLASREQTTDVWKVIFMVFGFFWMIASILLSTTTDAALRAMFVWPAVIQFVIFIAITFLGQGVLALLNAIKK